MQLLVFCGAAAVVALALGDGSWRIVLLAAAEGVVLGLLIPFAIWGLAVVMRRRRPDPQTATTGPNALLGFGGMLIGLAYAYYLHGPNGLAFLAGIGLGATVTLAALRHAGFGTRRRG